MSGKTKAERLEEMKRLYVQRAYSDIEMAERLGVDRTIVFRDRRELATGENNYPFEKDGEGRYYIPKSKLISEIKVNLHEALTLYLSARKTSRQTRFHSPHAANAVEKLAATLRQPMTERLLRSANLLLKQEKNPDKIKIIETVAQAWVEQRKVRIEYQALGHEGLTRHTISPYLIEPSIWSDSVYVIARSDFNDKIFAFKMERILSAFLSGETFEIPETFDDEQLLKHAWGIWFGDKDPVLVRLRFSPAVTRRVRESIWHPLESVEDAEDGGCIWSAEVAEPREMLPWVRGWGTHSTYIDGYYQNRLPIGANLGGGGYLYTPRLGWTSIDRPDHLRAFGTLFRGQASKTGPQPINAAFGQPASLSGLSLALEGEAAAGLKWQLGLSVQRYDGSNRPVTGLVAGIDIPIAAGR